jgi:hypothetical protein
MDRMFGPSTLQPSKSDSFDRDAVLEMVEGCVAEVCKQQTG